MNRFAVISPCGQFRYELRRIWRPEKPLVALIGLNPSTADAPADDPTLRRAINFAMQWGFGGLVMLNLFAYRTPHPRSMPRASDAVGPDNDATILRVVEEAETVVAAWGTYSWNKVQPRARAVVDMLRPCPLSAIATTKAGQPSHPLFLKAGLELKPWTPPWEDTSQ